MSHQIWKSLIKWKVSPNEIYFLDCCQSKIQPTSIINQDKVFESCKEKGLISENSIITDAGLIILNDFQTFLVKTKKKVASEILGDNFLDKVKEYREIFPSKRLPSGQLGRQSVQELKDKFIWFFKTYPEYDWDLILDATDYYNDVFRRKNYMYMATSSNFIKKTEITKEVSSKLADYCQQLIDNPKLIET
jgi:hypothetical protein